MRSGTKKNMSDPCRFCLKPNRENCLPIFWQTFEIFALLFAIASWKRACSCGGTPWRMRLNSPVSSYGSRSGALCRTHRDHLPWSCLRSASKKRMPTSLRRWISSSLTMSMYKSPPLLALSCAALVRRPSMLCRTLPLTSQNSCASWSSSCESSHTSMKLLRRQGRVTSFPSSVPAFRPPTFATPVTIINSPLYSGSFFVLN
mmetsp:Transcript_49533/g.101108  ORF Transcript_49533/g.101108 Transcript_49533/m.101108 type:complete len:202 (+) Transcript_49533:148-753(+)